MNGAVAEGVPPAPAGSAVIDDSSVQDEEARLVRENTSFEKRQKSPHRPEVCLVEKRAREFMRTLHIHEAYFDEQFDCCFCERCYPASLPDTITNEGPTPYVVPRGWFRVGLALPPRAKALDVFRQWSVSFHGTKDPLVLKSVLESGTLMKPGDKLMNGTTLRSTKCAGRQDRVMYTSPTIEYAGMKFYAKPQLFMPSASLQAEVDLELEPEQGHETKPQRMAASIVLQIRQKPGTFTTHGETMGFEKQTKSGKGPWPGYLAQACPHVDLATIEWKTETTSAAIPYGVLLRTFDPDDESETSERGRYSSPVGKSRPQQRQRDCALAAAASPFEPGQADLREQFPLPKDGWPEELKQYCLHQPQSELTGKSARVAADKLRKESPSEALALYVKAWNTGYQTPPLLNQMAMCFGPTKLDNDDLEVLLLSEAINFGTQRHKDACVWFNNRRRARTRAGDLEGALDDAMAVLQLAPDTERGDTQAASAREALLDLEGHPVSQFHDPELRGRTAFDLGNRLKNEDKNYAASLGMFLLARETAWVAGDPAPAVCYNQMAVCYSRLRDDQRAIDMYEAALREEPGHRDAYIWLNNLRRVYERTHDRINADKCARKGLKLCPANEKGRAKRKAFILAIIESEGHPHDELARQTLRDLERLSGPEALSKALELRDAGDSTDAIAMFVLARETGAGVATCYDWIGQCYSQAGAAEAPGDEAATCFKRAIDMYDLAILRSEMASRFVYYDHRRMAKAKAGDTTGALEDAKIAVEMCPETDQGREVAEQLRVFMASQGQGERQAMDGETMAEGDRSLSRGLSRAMSRHHSGASPPDMPSSSDEEYDGESD
eukprot:COSAG02_NODE_2364_length_9055_cov_12.230606_5_plen_838_part_00